MESIYVLTFTGTVEIEDIMIFTTLESGIEFLKKLYATHCLAEFKSSNNNRCSLYRIYYCDKDGNVTETIY